jgi:hypothetical protein
VQGDEKFYALRWIAKKPANGWVLLRFFVDMRHRCSTLGALSWTAPLPMAVDAAAPEEEAAHASDPVTTGASTPSRLLPSRPCCPLHAHGSQRPLHHASDVAAAPVWGITPPLGRAEGSVALSCAWSCRSRASIPAAERGWGVTAIPPVQCRTIRQPHGERNAP